MKRHTGSTKQHILEASLLLFLEKGYRDVSYADLIASTGLSKGAIYHYFTSKDELLEGVVEMLFEISTQTDYGNLAAGIKTISDFRHIFLGMKEAQFTAIVSMTDGQELKLNRLLFFIEAINESATLTERLKGLMETELQFIETCFLQLLSNNQIAGKASSTQLTSTFYWMMQGIEIKMFLPGNSGYGPQIVETYEGVFDDFFSLCTT